VRALRRARDVRGGGEEREREERRRREREGWRVGM